MPVFVIEFASFEGHDFEAMEIFLGAGFGYVPET